MENCNDEEEEEEEEEEEIIVYANFEEGTVDKEIFQQSDLKFKIIGLDSDTPVVQLGDTTFKGAWNDTIGTKVIFEEDTSPSEPVDPVFTVVPPKMLKYKCMTTKSLELSRIFLKPKNTDSFSNLSTAVNVVEDENNCFSINSKEEESTEEQQILNLVQSTINPDATTDAIMSDIVKQSALSLLKSNGESNEKK